ncbi:MAG: 30S ribosomal protein S9 [Elusimicrobia bacterium]|nr:30S ribosomal protein S9 [Elusimicrobiota bacterium]
MDLEAVVIKEPTEKKEAETAVQKPHSPSILWSTGRRKTSVAQVRMVSSRDGGQVKVNGQSVDEYFRGNKRQALTAVQSLQMVKGPTGFNLFIKVTGGGITGQAEAIRYGIARSLVQWDPKLRSSLRKEGFLTRDPRSVERKKSGQPKARKRFQYSKR